MEIIDILLLTDALSDVVFRQAAAARDETPEETKALVEALRVKTNAQEDRLRAGS